MPLTKVDKLQYIQITMHRMTYNWYHCVADVEKQRRKCHALTYILISFLFKKSSFKNFDIFSEVDCFFTCH
jgi:hypothetical protein